MAKKGVSEGMENPKNRPPKGETFVKGLALGGHGSLVAAIDANNGRLVRIRPLHYDWRYKPEEFRPWKIEAHSKVFEAPLKTLLPPINLAYKKRVYSPNRILYPLKRVDWDPNGERNPQNRGQSKFQRISWDEATDIIVNEIKRIHKKYGPYAILTEADGHGESKVVHCSHGCMVGLLKLMGGCTYQVRNPDSWEGWYWGAKHVWGMDRSWGLMIQTNCVKDVSENTRVLLFWGCDPEATSYMYQGQMASRLAYWYTDLGLKSIYICPDLNYGAAVHADKWIPILPNTDAALQLAIAYIWITEGTYDKQYVVTHTFGFDKFAEYVLGKEDGILKTPKWAEEITRVPARIIKALAREWASSATSVAHMCGGGMIRGQYSTEPARLEVCLLAMQGLGKPGVHQFTMGQLLMGYPRSVVEPSILAAQRGKPYGVFPPPKQIIPRDLIHEAILNPPVSWYGSAAQLAPAEDQMVKYTYPIPKKEGGTEIHMIWTDSPCQTTCWNDGNSLIKAFRHSKIEFILAQHPWLENDCLFADIILPVNTKFEETDIGVDRDEQFLSLFSEGKSVEPIGESRSDYEIVCTIAEKLGLLDKYTEGKSVKEWIRHGFDNSGVQNMISWEEFTKKQYYVIPIAPDWENDPPGMRKFYEDPLTNPLTTPTGRIEFTSTALAKKFPDDKERPPVPHWIPYGESHQESLQHPRSRKYPLLVVSNHDRWRHHAQCDDVSWLREIPTCKVRGPDAYLYEPVWIHPLEADKRGIKNGDIVKVFNERGAVLAGAYVTERIIPGVVSQAHGSRYDPIVPGELDRGGAINTITPHNITSKNATGMAVQGFLVEIERVDLEKLAKEYPEAFERPYNSVAGLRFNSWVE